MTMGEIFRRHRVLLVLSLALPPAAALVALFITVDIGSWPDLSARTLRALTADMLLYLAGGIIVAAPLAGVMVADRERLAGRGGADSVRLKPDTTRGAADPGRSKPDTTRVAFVLATAALLLVAMSSALLIAALGTLDRETLTFVGTSHATLAAVALALAAFGAFCGTAFSDPLDAAACSLTIVLLAAGGLLVAGASVSEAPRALLDLAMTASPLIAMTSAAHIDIVRMDMLYVISPLAHLQVSYPSWQTACAAYSLVAALCFGGMTFGVRVPINRSGWAA
jgi:hypothetical protein